MEKLIVKRDVLQRWITTDESITIPKNIKKIEEEAFEEAFVTEILVDEENEHFTSYGGVLFTKDMKILVAYPKCKKEKEYIIPEGVVQLGRYAFSNLKELKKLILPSTLEGNVTNTTFWDFANVDELVVPEGVKEIDYWFACCSSEKISLPSTLEKVDAYTFCTCYAKEISVHKENKHFKFENGCLYDYEGETLIRCFDDEIQDTEMVMTGVEKIYPAAFVCCEKLTKAKIPEGVIEIPHEAFWICKNLAEVELPSTVEIIGFDAFCDTKIKEIVLPEGVKEILHGAFGECDELEKVVLPDGAECKGDIFAGNYFVEIYCRENSKAHESVKKHMPVNKVKFL